MKPLIIWSIIGTGIASIAVQLITIREFLSQFHGNEITISLVIFCWLFLTAIGSLLARPVKKASLVLYALTCVSIALWPLLQLVFIRGFREAIFIHGLSPGFYQIFFYILATTAPYCLLIGFILPYSLTILEGNHLPFTSGELYITDNIGDLLGGMLFSFILVYLLKPFKSIAFTSGLLILMALWLLINNRNILALLLAFLTSCIIYFFLLNAPFELSTLSLQYGNIVRYTESPYGRIVITKEGPQHSFWESGTPLYSDVDIIKNEEKVHYPLSQLDRVDRILQVSGGIGEALEEILKYHPREIDYVDLDPYLSNAEQGLGFIKKNPSLTIIHADGRQYIKKTKKQYDAILLDLPDPDTFQINRFFTSEFFSYVKKALVKDGILSFSMNYSLNYISDVRKKKLSTIFNTAAEHFNNVLVLPGKKAYFLCRDGELWADIPARLSERSIQTDYIESFYQDNVTADRISKLQEIMDEEEYINTDFEPRMMNIVFQGWFMKHGTSPKAFLLILLGFVVLYLLFLKRQAYIIFSTGLTTMGVEMLVVFAFQAVYGTIYLKVGAIVTMFLLGMLPGAIMGNLTKVKSLTNIVLTEIIMLILLFIFFMWLIFVRNEPHQFYFLAYCVVFAFFCGYQFPAAIKLIGEERGPAPGAFTADLMGAAIGTFATGTLLIPLWGFQSAIIFLILIKISSNMLLLFVKGEGN